MASFGLRWVCLGVCLLSLACADEEYDPLRVARTSADLQNGEATIPPHCYTVTGSDRNPCYTCHTNGKDLVDWPLQAEYAFSDFGLTNRWHNLFVDRSAQIANIGEDEVLAYVRRDNYLDLKKALADRHDYAGFRPDLDYKTGFDEAGFAKDGSGWRQVRFKPFPGTFWPTNGATDDVLIRLPEAFRGTHYKANLEILERSMAAPDSSELPTHYVGGAAKVAVHRGLYPHGTEFLHSVRYLDPDAPGLMASRMKELRYSRKVRFIDRWGRARALEDEAEEKEYGLLPTFAGSPEQGLQNNLGWQYQGFIEDTAGRLRLQTREEHRACMGCHTSVGVTRDGSFAFPRKLPGAAGWAPQDIRGIPDVPQLGREVGEVAEYFQRVGGGDPFRANIEVARRFFRDNAYDPRDISILLLPSRQRALDLNRAYWLLVREQSFVRGRDPMIRPPGNVLSRATEPSTGLSDEHIYSDGRLRLDWSQAY